MGVSNPMALSRYPLDSVLDSHAFISWTLPCFPVLKPLSWAHSDRYYEEFLLIGNTTV